MIDADKARCVWAAAKVPGWEPLSIDDALALAHDIEWAATWRVTVRPPSKSPADLERQGRWMLQRLGRHRERALRGLRLVSRGLLSAASHERSAKLLHKRGTPQDLIFITQLAKTYLKHTGRKAAVSVTNRKFAGPFPRFVQEASRQFCAGLDVPSSTTIRRALHRSN